MSVDGCITKSPRGGERIGQKPCGPRKRGIKRSTTVDADGIPLGGNRGGSQPSGLPTLSPTLDAAWRTPSELPEDASVHLDRAYDWGRPAGCWRSRGLVGVIQERKTRSAHGGLEVDRGTDEFLAQRP